MKIQIASNKNGIFAVSTDFQHLQIWEVTNALAELELIKIKLLNELVELKEAAK